MAWFLVLYLIYCTALTLALRKNGLNSRMPKQLNQLRPPVTRVLIIGATGGTGRHLVTQALDRGYEVTALVRDPARLAVEHPRLHGLKGDVLDYASVEQSVRGQDAVVSALGHKRFLGPSNILSEGTRNLVKAMEAHGVRRFICETSLGIGSSAGRMGLQYTLFVLPVILPFYFFDKTRQERLIAASRLDWVVVRPGALTDAKGRGVWRTGDVGNFVTTVKIAREDVAHFMIDQLTEDSNLGAAVGICS
ncbi:MAG TPA: SDR family oxidoreductase [Bryobacteraceae bacterium]|nr:SDR family oxidoreductase [Bryobacteraceae bacterium]HPT28292.1 SDR family oxidoreductase [Bryobacteraceae bacterium]